MLFVTVIFVMGKDVLDSVVYQLDSKEIDVSKLIIISFKVYVFGEIGYIFIASIYNKQ